jgi:hypothetical protein
MYEDIDLYFMRARYYKPGIGRFLTEDPVWNSNLFNYCYNNPILNTDTNGENPTKQMSLGESLLYTLKDKPLKNTVASFKPTGRDNLCLTNQITYPNGVKEIRGCDIVKPFIINYYNNKISLLEDIINFRFKKVFMEKFETKLISSILPWYGTLKEFSTK